MKNVVRYPAVCMALLLPLAAAAADKPQISFKKTQLDAKFRSEGVAVGDFNHDGKLDIAAGPVYYAAPDWKMVPIVANPPEYDPHAYANSFVNAAADLNGDGWTDLLVADFPGKETWWFENPRGSVGPWRRHLCTPVTNNESPTFLDIDRDGKREWIMGVAPSQENPDSDQRQMAIVAPQADATKPWLIRPISARNAPRAFRYAHGLGVGDVNKDGRNDVLVTEGWWEAPADKNQAEWKFHAVKFGEDCAHMHVFDYDGDGDNDVLSSSAHRHGVWWHEQTPDGFKTHEIERNFSQSHAMCLADINGDGLPDFVTGKRWWAHGPQGDPDSDKPAVLVWFELSRSGGKPVWTPHKIDDDSGIGTQFEVADVNGDGLLDIAIGNKKGAFYFEQVRK